MRSALITGLLVSYNVVAQSGLDLADISLPPGFSIEIWTDNVPNARSMALGANGTVFVATRRDGRVYAVVPEQASIPSVYTIAENLKMPNGVAFRDGDLYVAENHQISRFDDIETRLDGVSTAVIVMNTLSTEKYHGWRYIDFGPDGKLYVALGAPCNVCERKGLANISRMNADGSDQQVVASGIRNSVGFDWHPDTDELWFTDNGRDMLGDDTPPREFNRVRTDGMHFGFPFCHGEDIADPEFGGRRECSEFVAPVQKLGPHVAALGIEFYRGEMFPSSYSGQAFIAEHGSWNRSKKIGYRISLVRMEAGEAVGYETFADG
jgi:glucose/arabinose dehydrogenase